MCVDGYTLGFPKEEASAWTNPDPIVVGLKLSILTPAVYSEDIYLEIDARRRQGPQATSQRGSGLVVDVQGEVARDWEIELCLLGRFLILAGWCHTQSYQGPAVWTRCGWSGNVLLRATMVAGSIGRVWASPDLHEAACVPGVYFFLLRRMHDKGHIGAS